MTKQIITLALFMCSILFFRGADAHVPFIEESDFSESEPFSIEHPIEKSRAIYGWLQSGTDIDVYIFEFKEQTRLSAFFSTCVPRL